MEKWRTKQETSKWKIKQDRAGEKKEEGEVTVPGDCNAKDKVKIDANT